jgi:hypothetical protein
MQEEIGTGGGGFRYLYAAFLQESYDRLQAFPLQEAARRMRETGDLWRQFALACGRSFKNRKEGIDLAHIAGLLRQCGESEKGVYQTLRNLS